MSEVLGPSEGDSGEVGSASVESNEQEGIDVDGVFLAERLGEEPSGEMDLFTPQREVAVEKSHGDRSRLETTSIHLESPLQLTYAEFMQQWHPNAGSGTEGLGQRIREAIEAGHDGIIVEPDPGVAVMKEEGRWPSNRPYTFESTNYFKFVVPVGESES